MTAEEIDAAGRRLKKALMERMLGGQLSYHLWCPPGGAKPDDTTIHRNGTSEKRVLTDDGPMGGRYSAGSGGHVRAAVDSEARPPPGGL